MSQSRNDLLAVVECAVMESYAMNWATAKGIALTSSLHINKALILHIVRRAPCNISLNMDPSVCLSASWHVSVVHRPCVFKSLRLHKRETSLLCLVLPEEDFPSECGLKHCDLNINCTTSLELYIFKHKTPKKEAAPSLAALVHDKLEMIILVPQKLGL